MGVRNEVVEEDTRKHERRICSNPQAEDVAAGLERLRGMRLMYMNTHIHAEGGIPCAS